MPKKGAILIFEIAKNGDKNWLRHLSDPKFHADFKSVEKSYLAPAYHCQFWTSLNASKWPYICIQYHQSELESILSSVHDRDDRYWRSFLDACSILADTRGVENSCTQYQYVQYASFWRYHIDFLEKSTVRPVEPLYQNIACYLF